MFFDLFVCVCGTGVLNSGLQVYKVGALPLEPHLQSILLWLFWRWDLAGLEP
jgi:predicted naringenin-chalcone synthase